MSLTASISRYGKTEPFELQVARGQIAWHYPVNVFGYQAAVGTSTSPVGVVVEGILIRNDA